jgi:hypothetical protein
LDKTHPFFTVFDQISFAFGSETIDTASSTAPPVWSFLPHGLNISGFFQPIQSWVERTLFQVQETAASLVQTVENLKPVCLATFQDR